VIWQSYPATSEPTTLTGAVRTYSPPTADELYEIREATWVGAVRQGRVVAMVQMHDAFGAGLAAVAQGDTRPGTGASFYEGTTQQEAEARLADNLATARADAARLAEEASQHLGEG
jgi:hypothetical protein